MVETLRMVIEGSSKGAQQALDELNKKAGTSNTAFGKWGAGVNKAGTLAMMGFVGLGALIGKSVSDYASFALQVAKVNAQSGMGAKATSLFVGQLQLLHANTSSAGMAMKTLEVQIAGAKDGTAASIDLFNKLGISQQQLKDTSPADMIGLVRDRLSEMTDKSEQQLVASKLLGRAAKDDVLWYTASADSMNKVNTALKANGQILSEGQLQSAEKAGLAWQNFLSALKGTEYAVAQAALPALTSLMGPLTGVMRLMRPFAPALVSITVGLGILGGGIKTYIALQKTWNQLLSILPAKLFAAKGAEEGMAAATGEEALATRGANAAMVTAIGLYGAIAIAAAASAFAVYKAVQAFEAMADAINQAKAAQAQFQSNAAYDEQMIGQKYGFNSPQYASVAAVANAKTNKAGVSYTSGGSWGDFAKSVLTKGVIGSWFSEGGSFVASKPTVIGVGERGTERVDITPLGKGGGRGGGGIYNDFRGAQFSAHSPRELAEQVGDVIMSKVVANIAGVNA
jgi:hypothetical protein